jgi:hypothetical protein
MTWTNDHCEREPEMRRLAHRNPDDATLQAHAAECAVCRETLMVISWMRELAALPVDRSLPDPAYLWWKGALLRQWDAQRRAAAPIERGEPVQVGIGLLGAMVLLIWLWRQGPSLAAVASDAGVWNSTLLLTTIVSLGLLVGIAVVSVRELLLETHRKERT